MHLILKRLQSKLYRNRNKYRLALGVSICVLSVCSFIRLLSLSRSDSTHVEQEPIIHWVPRRSLLSCHNSREKDYLKLLRKNASLPPNSIFFTEATCEGGLNIRQACAVESAAKAHPDYQVNVIFTSSVARDKLEEGYLYTLVDSYKNVKLFRVRITEYAEETPVAGIVSKMDDDSLDMHAPRMMKFLTLYKYSGIYLGLDVMVARPLELWSNWAIRDSPSTLSTNMFAFSQNHVGRQLAKAAMGYVGTEIARRKVRESWSYSGPTVMSNLLENWCTTTNIQLMSLSSCSDLAVYGPELFYPISFHDRKTYFSVVDWEAWKQKNIYTYVVWNYFTKFKIITPAMLYGKLAKEFCPMIYHRYSDEFGVWHEGS